MMEGKETLKTLCNPIDKYEGCSVFEINFNGTNIKMMCFHDVKRIVKTASILSESPKNDYKWLQELESRIDLLQCGHGTDSIHELANIVKELIQVVEIIEK